MSPRCNNRKADPGALGFPVNRGGVFVSILPRPISLVAERAVRYLKVHTQPLDSRSLASAVLAIETADQPAARRVLQTAFAGDPRLVCGPEGWQLATGVPAARREKSAAKRKEPDRVLIFLQGRKTVRGKPFELLNVSIMRLRGNEVLGACGGDTPAGPSGDQLRDAILEILSGATIVVHDPPRALRAFEKWLGEDLVSPISLRRLAQVRLRLPANHELESLVARLGLMWRASDDPLDHADVLDDCLRALRRPGESLDDLRLASSHGGVQPIDWSRYAFGRSFLRRVPRTPGTYRFYDSDENLLYVGKSKNLHHRLASYFREGLTRSPRVQQLLDRLHRIDYDASGSELEAILREAELIRQKHPRRNVQRHVHEGRGARLRSILIIESAEPPHLLRAYLIHEGRLVGRIGIGPRGGGLRRIERVLHDYFFFAPEGPTPPAGPDLDVELVVRWLATARDRVVAFDPTSLRSPHEVVTRLRWFLNQGSPFDPEGDPVFPR